MNMKLAYLIFFFFSKDLHHCKIMEEDIEKGQKGKKKEEEF